MHCKAARRNESLSAFNIYRTLDVGIAPYPIERIPRVHVRESQENIQIHMRKSTAITKDTAS